MVELSSVVPLYLVAYDNFLLNEYRYDDDDDDVCLLQCCAQKDMMRKLIQQ